MAISLTVVAAFLLLDLASLFYYFRLHSSKTLLNKIYPVVVSVIAVLAIVAYLGEIPGESYLLMIGSFAILLPLLPSYFTLKRWAFVVTLALLIAELVYAIHYNSVMLFPFIQAFAIGTLVGLPHIGRALNHGNKQKENKKVEIRRDFVQIGMGIVLLILFYYLPVYTAAYTTVVLMLLGYLTGGLLLGRRTNIVYKTLSTLERPDALFGTGALYIAIGTAIIVGFVYNAHFLMIGITALFIADSLATIVGKNFDGIKLFYNKRKTLWGTLAFFLAVALIGYPFVGNYALAFAAVLALVESADLRLDDNISIALVMVLLYAVYLAVF